MGSTGNGLLELVGFRPSVGGAFLATSQPIDESNLRAAGLTKRENFIVCDTTFKESEVDLWYKM